MIDKIPDFKPPSLDERIKNAAAAESPEHHSFTDWDFENVDWSLDDGIYHAAAPSFTGTGLGYALVKNATTGALSDGRIVAWVRSSSVNELIWFTFRNQKPDGDADGVNHYWLRLSKGTTGIRLHRLIGGAQVTIDTKTYPWAWSLNTWYKIRVTWWTAADRLNVRTERWDGEAWVTLGGNADDDIEDPDDQFKDAEVNRCGVRYYTALHFDDLEVWG